MPISRPIRSAITVVGIVGVCFNSSRMAGSAASTAEPFSGREYTGGRSVASARFTVFFEMPRCRAIALPFPRAAQVLLIERTVTGRGDGKIHRTAEPAVTSAPWHRADPADLAALVRGQWSIETVHNIRDVTYNEDASRVHTGQSPRLMVSLRNTATSIIGLMSWGSVPRANDHYRDHPQHTLQVIGLTTPHLRASDQLRRAS